MDIDDAIAKTVIVNRDEKTMLKNMDDIN